MTKRGPDNLADELSAYLDGELSEQRAEQVRRLLAESDEARRRLEELRAVSGQLAALPRMRAPDELTAAMTRRAERRLLLDERGATRRPRVLRLFVKSCAAAAVLAACVLVGYRTLQAPEPAGDELVRSLSAPESEPPPAMPMSIAKRELSSGRGRGRSVDPGDLVVAAAPDAAAEMADRLSSPGVVTRQAGRAAEGPAELAERAAERDAAASMTADSISPEPVVPLGIVATAAEEPDLPTVDLWISALDADQYAANREILARWTVAGQRKPEPDLAEVWAYSADLPASELVRRISLLSAANPRERLRVETDFGAADSEVFVAVAQALAAQPTTPTRASPESAHARSSEPADERISLLGAPRQTAGGSATAPGESVPAGKGAAGVGGRSGAVAGGEGEPTPAAQPRAGGRMAPERGPRRPSSGGKGGQTDLEAMRERIRRRHAEATAEPELDVIFVEPPSSRPETLPVDQSPAPAASTCPASAPAPPQPRPGPGNLLDRLVRLLFGDLVGTELGVAADLDDGAAALGPSATGRVRLRVMLLPPPTSAPASQSVSPPDAGPGDARPGT